MQPRGNSLFCTKEEYRKVNSLSQSRIKSLERGIGSLSEEDMKKSSYTSSLAIGNVVDWLLTVFGIEESDPYTVVDSEKPTGYMGKFIGYLLKGMSPEAAYKKVNFKQDSFEVVMQKLSESDYYDAMSKVESGELVITKKDLKIATAVYQSLTSHKHTAFWCEKNYEGAIHAAYQVGITFDYNDVECKALLDKIIIDEENKIIYPIDFKTTRYLSKNFRRAFDEHSYGIQAVWYRYALRKAYPGYTIGPFRFVVETTRPGKQGCPLLFQIGGRTWNDNVRRVDHLIELYKWHKKHGFTYDKDIMVNNGLLTL